MAEELLNGADVSACLEKVRRERMSQRMTCRALRYSANARCVCYGSLNNGVVQMMSTLHSSFALPVRSRRREHVLPDPLSIRIGKLDTQCAWQRRATHPRRKVVVKLPAHSLQVHAQRRDCAHGQRHATILSS